MGTYRATVRLTRHGEYHKPGDIVAYDGPLDPKFEPIDKAEHRRWLTEAADAAYVVNESARFEDYTNPSVGREEATAALQAKWTAYSAETK